MDKNGRKSEQLCVKVLYPSSLIFDIFGCKSDEIKYSDMIVKASNYINKSVKLFDCIEGIKNKLSEKQRQIFESLYERDLTKVEIVDELSMSLNIVTKMEKDLIRELRKPQNAKNLIPLLPKYM